MADSGILSRVSVVVGGVLGFGGGLWTTRQAYKRQLERDRISHDWAMQDAKRERLRAAYQTILAGSQQYGMMAFRFDKYLGTPLEMRGSVIWPI